MTSGTIETKLARFLFKYRTTPHTTTGQTPSELLMGRKLRIHFDHMIPDIRNKVHEKQLSQKKYHDSTSAQRKFIQGDHVYIRNYSRGPR